MTSPTEKHRVLTDRLEQAVVDFENASDRTYQSAKAELQSARAAIHAALDKSEREGMKRAAEIIRDGVERPVSVAYRMDGKPSKNDKCPHDFYVYEDCEECCVAAILSEAGEG